ANGGGSSTTRNLVARVVTVNAGTGALTLEAAAASATNDKNNTGLRVLAAYTEGASYIAAAQNGTVTTTGDFYGITVAGTVTTISAATQRALDLPAVHAPGTWNYVLGGSAVMRYDATTMLFGHLAGGAYAVTIAGTVLTFGATFALSGASTILVDAATGANFYAVAATTFDKISVAAGVITSAWQVSAAPTLVVSDTLTDKAVSYAGTWYTWSLSPVAAVTSTRWLFDSGNNFIYGGPVT
ncbi:MAG TPA: hypothetical protein VLJ86_20155, partial [Ramlibacter sp.]|nr:hypothetical protein [Ramlibacter sp.]